MKKDFCGSLANTLLRFGSVNWTLGQAAEGVLITGATGSGKTSGSGKHLAHAYLKAGMGGLVLCAKPDERQRWEQYATECERKNAVIVMDGTGKERFNFLDYSLSQAGGGETLNLVTLFVQLAEAARLNKGGGGAADPFWQDAMKELLSHSMDALIAAYGQVRLAELQRFIETLPLPDDKREKGFCYQTMQKAYMTPVRPLATHDLEVIKNYIFENMRRMADKTRSGIISNFTSLAHGFIKGTMHSMFCTDSTLVPELAHEGAIIIVDLPVKTWGTSGILAAHVMKFLFQKTTERRVCTEKTRPVFLWADECQFFLSEYDNEFQSTARSSRACTVYLTQNLSGIYSTIGGSNPEHSTEALLGNLRTKIFHLNDNRSTNQWAADLIGKDIQHRRNWSQGTGSSTGQSEGKNSSWGNNKNYNLFGLLHNSSGKNKGRGSSSGINSGTSENRGEGSSEQIDYRVQPSFFAEGLRNGGKDNDCKVDAVIVQAGQKFNDTGGHWGLCTFPQN